MARDQAEAAMGLVRQAVGSRLRTLAIRVTQHYGPFSTASVRDAVTAEPVLAASVPKPMLGSIPPSRNEPARKPNSVSGPAFTTDRHRTRPTAVHAPTASGRCQRCVHARALAAVLCWSGDQRSRVTSGFGNSRGPGRCAAPARRRAGAALAQPSRSPRAAASCHFPREFRQSGQCRFLQPDLLAAWRVVTGRWQVLQVRAASAPGQPGASASPERAPERTDEP